MSDRRFRWVACLLAAALVIAAGAPSLHNGFLNYDDPGIILENPGVQAPGVASAVAAWTERHEHAWLPLYVDALIADASIFGLDPAGFHLSSLVWHALSAVLVVLFVHALSSSRAAALLAGALFATHPVAAESVAWAAGRKDQVSLVLLLLSLAFALGHLRRGGAGRIVGAAFFLALALLAKGSVVVGPLLVILLWLWCRADRTLAPVARPRALLLATLAVAVGITAVHYAVALDEGTAADTGRFTLGEHGLIFLQALGRYGLHLFAPLRLSIHYEVEPEPQDALTWAGALILLMAMAAFVLLLRRQRGPLGLASFALLFAVVSVAPFNGIFPKSALAMADRYLIVALPMVGVLVAAVLARVPTVLRVAVAVALIGLSIAAARPRYAEFRDGETVFRSAMQTEPGDPLPMLKLGEALRSPPTTTARRREAIDLFRAAVIRSPDPVREARARLLLADALLDARRYGEAVVEYERLIGLAGAHDDLLRRFGFDASTVRFNHVAALFGAEQYVLGRELLEELLRDEPRHARARLLKAGLDLRRAYEVLVDARNPDLIRTAQRTADESIAIYEGVIVWAGEERFRPRATPAERRFAADVEVQARCEVARVLRQASWRDDHLNAALTHAEFVVRNWPERIDGWLTRAQIAADVDPNQAGGDLRQAIERDPRSSIAKRAFAEWLMRMGHNRDAVRVLEAAYTADPDDQATRRALRDVYVAAGRSHLDPTQANQKRDPARARQAFEMARRYVPDDAESWTLSGQCAESENDWEAAAVAFERARALDPRSIEAARGLARYHQARGLAALAGASGHADSRAAASRPRGHDDAPDRIAAEFRTAIGLAPDSDDLDLARGWLRGRDRSATVDPVLDRAEGAIGRQDWEQAQSLLDAAVKMDDAYWRTFELRGHFGMQRGDTVLAREAFERTLALDPENLPANDAVARLAYQRGDYDRARATAKRFLAIAGKPASRPAALDAELALIRQLLAAIDELRPESRR